MGRITVTETINAPVATVFAYVDDHTNTTKYMKDLVKWEPVGDKVHGKGAHIAVAMKAGPATLDSDVDITTWTENKVIAWTSRRGTFKQNGKWTFSAAGDGTKATLDMDYEFAGGIAGKILGRAAEPFVRGNLEESVKNLKAQVEKSAKKTAAKR